MPYAQLEKILASDLFQRPPQLSRLLFYIVKNALEEGAAGLKEYDTGRQVLRKPANFDVSLDPIVRVKARRLRSRLAEEPPPGKRETRSLRVEIVGPERKHWKVRTRKQYRIDRSINPMRIRLRCRSPLAASLTLIGCSLAAFAAAKYAVGMWSEYRDRIEFASSLHQGLPLLTIPGPRQRRPGTGPSAAVMPIGLGVMAISRLNLAVLIRPGSSEAELDKGAGWIPGTARPGEPGNVCLAGRRDTFFRRLREIRVGDAVVLKTPAGPLWYEVRETMVVEPNDTSVLRPTTTATLTLVTCFPFHYVGSAPKRFVVRATTTGFD